MSLVLAKGKNETLHFPSPPHLLTPSPLAYSCSSSASKARPSGDCHYVPRQSSATDALGII
ncbi:MAG: hypothetical protein MK135_03805 [Polyangiaceae bacterium]|nr:hypothetical protein [Polyangiaceae bacterium]